MTKIIKIGDLHISLASVIVLVSALIVALTSVFMAPKGWVAGLSILLGGVLASYNVNCAQVGQCTIWAWFLTALYIIGAVFIIVGSIFIKKTVAA